MRRDAPAAGAGPRPPGPAKIRPPAPPAEEVRPDAGAEAGCRRRAAPPHPVTRPLRDSADALCEQRVELVELAAPAAPRHLRKLVRADQVRGDDHLGPALAEVDELDRRLTRLDHRVLGAVLAEAEALRGFDDDEVAVVGIFLAVGSDHRHPADAAGFQVELDFLARRGEMLG